MFAEQKQDHNACTGVLQAGSLLLMHAPFEIHSQLIKPDEGLEMHVPPSVFMACIQEGGGVPPVGNVQLSDHTPCI